MAFSRGLVDFNMWLVRMFVLHVRDGGIGILSWSEREMQLLEQSCPGPDQGEALQPKFR